MKIHTTLQKISEPQEIALTIGNFDGMHKGHIHLIQTLIQEGREKNVKTAVLTFQNHPKDLIEKTTSPTPLIFPLHQKINLLKSFPLDHLFIIPFTTEIQRLSPLEFLSYLKGLFNLRFLLLGYDGAFGKDRAGTKELMLSLSETLSIKASYLPPLCYQNLPISSSRIRSALSIPDFPLLNSLLGKPYALSLFLEKGASLGKKLVYPTFNFSVLNLFLPPYGVYEVFLTKGNAKFHGIANLGVAPTLKNTPSPTLEVHILSNALPEEDYNSPYLITFSKFIREERHFLNAESLKNQIALDISTMLVSEEV